MLKTIKVQLGETEKVCLEFLAETGARSDQFNVRCSVSARHISSGEIPLPGKGQLPLRKFAAGRNILKKSYFAIRIQEETLCTRCGSCAQMSQNCS